MSTILPGSQRFNRGSMNQAELVGRIVQSNAKAALIVSMFKGNPRDLKIILPDGSCRLTVRIESATLRREISPESPRVKGLRNVFIQSDSKNSTKSLARSIAELLDAPVSLLASMPPPEPAANGLAIMWFETEESGRTLWTHFHALDGTEIGPRIRVVSITSEELQ
jgi:hypothetical protein